MFNFAHISNYFLTCHHPVTVTINGNNLVGKMSNIDHFSRAINGKAFKCPISL
jgi:hypothetical protein